MLRKKFLHLDFIGKIYLSVGIFSIIVLVFCIWLSNQRGFVQILPFQMPSWFMWIKTDTCIMKP